MMIIRYNYQWDWWNKRRNYLLPVMVRGKLWRLAMGHFNQSKLWSTSTFIHQVNYPCYICYIKGSIFAASNENRRITAKINDENIKVANNYKWNGPFGICDDLKGNLLVADSENNRIVRVNLKWKWIIK